MFSEWLPASIDPYAGLSVWLIALVIAIHALGCLIRGAFGFGSNMPIVLLSTWILGPHHAILLAVMSTAVAQAHLLPQGIKSADWPVARPLLIGQFVGVVLGTWAFTVLAPEWLTLILGILIAGVIAIDRFRLMERLGTTVDLRARPVTTGLALTGATVGTISGGGGLYFLVAYLKLVCTTPAGLRGTNLMLSTFFLVTRVASLLVAGLITPTLVIEGLILAPAVLLATWAGTHVFRRASVSGFYAALQLLLVLAAAALIVRGLVRVA